MPRRNILILSLSKDAGPDCSAQHEVAPTFTTRRDNASPPVDVGAPGSRCLHETLADRQFVSGPWSMYLGSFITAKGWAGSLTI